MRGGEKRDGGQPSHVNQQGKTRIVGEVIWRERRGIISILLIRCLWKVFHQSASPAS